MTPTGCLPDVADEYLIAACLQWTSWAPSRPDSIADHCESCPAEISNRLYGPRLRYDAAWLITNGERGWICPPCFIAHSARFEWIITIAEPKPTPWTAVSHAAAVLGQ